VRICIFHTLTIYLTFSSAWHEKFINFSCQRKESPWAIQSIAPQSPWAIQNESQSPWAMQNLALKTEMNIQIIEKNQILAFKTNNNTQCLWKLSNMNYNIQKCKRFDIKDNQVYHIHSFEPFYINKVSTITGCAIDKTMTAKSLCLSLDINLCNQSNRFSWWNHIKSSPLLEFYIRMCFSLIKYMFPISQRSTCAIRCREINMKMRRTLFRKHDFLIYMKQLNGAQLIWTNLSAVICIALRYHILAFKLIILLHKLLVYYFVKIVFLSVKYIIFGYFNLLMLICFILNTMPFTFNSTIASTNKIIGGGISKVFIFDELALFTISKSNIDKSNKIKFLKYMTQDKANELLATNNLLIVCNLPLNNLMPKLVISDLKVIAECHKVTIHSKMKSQEIQAAIGSHVCNTCEQYVSVFETINILEQEQKAKTKHSEAVKKHKAKDPEKYKAFHLEAVQKNQRKYPEQYKHQILKLFKSTKAKILNNIKLLILKLFIRIKIKIQSNLEKQT
jgi:hypothetical protein